MKKARTAGHECGIHHFKHVVDYTFFNKIFESKKSVNVQKEFQNYSTPNDYRSYYHVMVYLWVIHCFINITFIMYGWKISFIYLPFACMFIFIEDDKKKNMKSLKRRLSKHLVLVTNQCLGDKKHFLLPQGIRQDGETLRQVMRLNFNIRWLALYF